MSRFIAGTCRTQATLFPDRLDDYITDDGSKFKAVNSKENNYTPIKVECHIKRVEKHIDDYMKQLDAADHKDDQVADNTTIEDKITGLKQKLAELNELKEVVNNHPEKQLSTVDPDSRLMKTRGMTRAVC